MSRREQIVVAIREAIVTGVIPTGTQLKQDELASIFRASPAPVREALRELVSEGLVEHVPNRGSFVCQLAADELLEVLLPVRVAAEAYAMKKIAQELAPRLLEALTAQIAVMDRGASKKDLAEVIEADVQFHRIMVEAADSYHVTQLWGTVLSRTRMQLYRLGPRHSTLREVPDEHRELLAALQTQDPEVIQRTLEEHIIGASSALLPRDSHDAGPAQAGRK